MSEQEVRRMRYSPHPPNSPENYEGLAEAEKEEHDSNKSMVIRHHYSKAFGNNAIQYHHLPGTKDESSSNT